MANPVLQWAGGDDRALLASGLRALLSAHRDVEVVDHDALQPGATVLVGSCATPYRSRPGIRVMELVADRSVDDLLRALRRGTTASGRTRKRGQALSKQEQMILAMTAEGSSATQIAERLGLSARTVERHRRAVAEKLAVRSTAHAVAVGAAADGVDIAAADRPR